MRNLEAGTFQMPDRTDALGSIDRSVGHRIRARRELMGLTPEAFAARLGCEPDLILSYEGGRTRVGAIALLRLSELCEVDVGYFLAELKEGP